MAYSYVLALAAPKGGNVINKAQSNKKKEREDVAKGKIPVEDYLERSDNEIGTGKTKPKRKRTSKSQIRKVSPYFTNDCEKKAAPVQECGSEFEAATLIGSCENILQEKGEENGDGIAIERAKYRRKRTSKKHGLVESDEAPSLIQSDNGKVDAGSPDYDASVGSVALPGLDISLLVDKQQEIVKEVAAGKVKFKREKKKKKAFEGKLQESGNDTKTLDAKTSRTKPEALKKRALDGIRYVSPYFHNDGGKKLEQQGLDSHVDAVALAATHGDLFLSELQESCKGIESVAIKTKTRRKSKSHKTAEEHAEVQKVSPYSLNNNEKKTVCVEAFDDKSGFHSVPFTGGDIFRDKVKENGDKIAIMIKTKGKRTSKMHEQIGKVSPFFQSDNKKLDAESHCYGHETGSLAFPYAGGCFLEDNLTENGNIKSKKKKKKKKAIADMVQENGNGAETSCVKSKKKRLKVHKTIADGAVRYVSPYFHKNNVKASDVESKSESVVLPTYANIKVNKLQDNDSEMKFKQEEIHVNSVALTANSGDFFEDKLQEGGNEIETIAIISKKKRKMVNQKTAEETRKISPYFQNDDEKKTVSAEALDHEGEFNSVASGTNIVQDKGEENGHMTAKRTKPKGKKISKKHEPLEHAQIRTLSPFFQSGNEKADAESCYVNEIGSIALSGSAGSFLEDRPLQNRNVTEDEKIKSNKKRKAIADKLQENGNNTETSNVDSKKTTPIVQKNIASGAVRYVSPYFHNDSGKKINVKTCNKESKSESVALSTCGKLREDKLQETHGKKNKQKGLESHLGSVALTPAAGDLFEHELQENGNGVVPFETFAYKGNSKSQKTLEHGEVGKVSPYFLTQCLSGCEQVQKAKKVRKNKEVTEVRKNKKVTGSRTRVNSKVKGNRRKKSTKKPLSSSEKKAEAYKRRTPDNTWKPPRSPCNLLQEDHAHDPWRVLVICMLLNLTTGRQAKAILSNLFDLCPDAQTCTEVATEEIEEVIKSLGLQKKRSMALQRLSREYLDESWTHVTQLHGVGKYGADAYAIFCTGKWDQVTPNDTVLNTYWDFLHTIKDTL